MLATENSTIVRAALNGISAPQSSSSTSTLGATNSSDSPKAAAVRSASEKNTDTRKLRLLQRSGLFGQDTKGATVERAIHFDDLRQAYQLVHDVYLRSGFINAEPSNIRLRIFETCSETATFVAKKDGQIVGVLSVVTDSYDLGLPSDSAFRPELDELRAAGKRLCEVTNQVVLEDYRSSAVSSELMRCAIAHTLNAGLHAIIATVSPSHNGFYDLIGFELCGSERSYSTKLHDPVIAMSIDLMKLRHAGTVPTAGAEFFHQFSVKSNPYNAYVATWDNKAKTNFLSPELLERLFVNERNFLAECSADQIESIKIRWGKELYSAVTGSFSPVQVQDWQPDTTGAESSDALVLAASRQEDGNFGRTDSPFSTQMDEAPIEKLAAQLYQGIEKLHDWLSRVSSGLPNSRIVWGFMGWLVPGASRRLIANR